MKNKEKIKLIENLLFVNFNVNVNLNNMKNKEEIELIEKLLFVNFNINVDLNKLI